MKLKNLSALEQLIMNFMWQHGASTAEACREGLADRHPLKDSTIRTLLRRLEAKGYLQHEVDGRTYLYRPLEPAANRGGPRGEADYRQAVRWVGGRATGGHGGS